MTQPISSSTTSATASASASQHLDESVGQVLSLLSGKRVVVGSQTKIKMTEDVLYTALIYDDLKTVSPKTAKAFQSELKERFDRRTERNDTQPLARAVADILANAVESKTLTTGQVSALTKAAFGQAQLDKAKGRLSRTARDATLAQIHAAMSQKAATSESMKPFTDRMEKGIHLAPPVTKRQRKQIARIISSVAASSPQVQSPSTPKAESNGVVPSKLPGLLDQPTGPHDFVYDPTDPKKYVSILVPVLYAHEIRSACLLGTDGKLLEDLAHRGLSKDGRREFRSKSGLPSMPTVRAVRLDFVDGTSVSMLIPNGAEPLVQKYLP